jgi:hypothetical protein
MAVVGVFLIGCAVLLVVGCAGTRSEAPQEERQGHTEATREEQGSLPKAAAEAEECAGTRTVDVLKRAGVDKVFDSSVQPGDPEARFTTNDLPGCPNGGILEGTDKSDKLAGEYDEDEVRGLGAKDTLSGGSGGDVLLYGGPGNDELQAGAGPVGVKPFTDSSKNTLHGGAGKDFLVGAEGDDVIYGGEGDDKMFWGGGGEGEEWSLDSSGEAHYTYGRYYQLAYVRLGEITGPVHKSTTRIGLGICELLRTLQIGSLTSENYPSTHSSE